MSSLPLNCRIDARSRRGWSDRRGRPLWSMAFLVPVVLSTMFPSPTLLSTDDPGLSEDIRVRSRRRNLYANLNKSSLPKSWSMWRCTFARA